MSGVVMLAAVSIACGVSWLPYVRDCLPSGDSGELIVSAVTLASAHPPGYPFFTLLYGAVASIFEGTASPTWLLNMLTILLSTAAACVMSASFAATDPLVGFAVALLWVSMPTVRMLATQTEVFALHHLTLSLAFFLFDRWWRNVRSHTAHRNGEVVLLAGVCSLVVANQHAGLLPLLPMMIVVAVRTMQDLPAGKWCRLVLCCVMCVLCVWSVAVMAVYAIQTLGTGCYGWGDGEGGIVGAVLHFARADYGTFQLHAGGLAVAPFIDVMSAAALWMRREGCAAAFGATLLLLSLRSCNCRVTRLIAVYAASAASCILGLALIGNIPLTHGVFVHVYHRLWAQSTIPICMALGTALSASRWKMHVTAAIIAVVLLQVLRPSPQVFSSLVGPSATDKYLSEAELRDLQHAASCVVEAFAVSATTYLPQGAVIYTLGDVYLTSLRYGLSVRRQDGGRNILHVDRELLSFTWAKRWLVKTLRLHHVPNNMLERGYLTVQHLAAAVNAGPERLAAPSPLFLLESPEFVAETPNWKDSHGYYAEGWFYRLMPKDKYAVNCSAFGNKEEDGLRRHVHWLAAEDPALSLFANLVGPKALEVDVQTVAAYFPWESLVLQQYYVARKNLLLRAATEAQVCLGRQPKLLLSALRQLEVHLRDDVGLPHHYEANVLRSSVQPFAQLLATTIDALEKHLAGSNGVKKAT